MLQKICLWLDSNGWIIVLGLYIIYIIVCLINSFVKNKKVDVNLLYNTLKKIPSLMSNAELLFPSGSGADKLNYVVNLIKLLVSETNPNSALLTYDWESLVQDIFDASEKINAKGEN